MNRATTPRLTTVIKEQFSVVGLAVRREALIVLVIVSALVALTVFDALRLGQAVSLGDLDALGLIAGALGFFFPFVVWKGERFEGDSLLWSLPVDHATHLLAKVVVGWGWLVLLLFVSAGLCLLVPVLTGGSIGMEETRLVLDASAPGGAESVVWRRPTWKWLTLFGGASALYWIASALVLVTPHSWRLGVGAIVSLGVILSIFLISISTIVPAWAISPVSLVMDPLLFGPYGLDVLLTGGSESITTSLSRPSGEYVVAWHELPTLRRWSTAVLLWSATGLATTLTAVARFREDG